MDSIKEDENKKPHREEAAKKKNIDDDLQVLDEKSKLEKQSSSSSTTSTDSSSEGDFFQLEELGKRQAQHAETNTEEVLPSGTRAAFHENNGGVSRHSSPSTSRTTNLVDLDIPFPSAPQHEQSPVARTFSAAVEEQTMLGRPLSPDIPISSHASDSYGVYGGLQSPQTQTMVRNDAPDPNRIPSSIFTRTRSTTPMEWSVASNESLFSIHVGNSSFSRDQVFLLGRSGELGNFPSPIEYQLPMTAPSASPVSSVTGHRLEPPETAQEANAEAMKEVLRAAAETQADKDNNKSLMGGASVSRHSDGSTTSFRSFAFPMSSTGSLGSVSARCCCCCCEIGCKRRRCSECSHCWSIRCLKCCTGGCACFQWKKCCWSCGCCCQKCVTTCCQFKKCCKSCGCCCRNGSGELVEGSSRSSSDNSFCSCFHSCNCCETSLSCCYPIKCCRSSCFRCSYCLPSLCCLTQLTGDRSGSLKTDPQISKAKSKKKQPVSQPDTTTTTPSPAPAPVASRWFPCFTCSYCC